MKKSRLLQKTLLLGVTGMLLFPATVSAASSYYKVDKYGELYDYKGSQNVTIRENTSAISYDAFSDNKTTSFTVAAGNPYFKSVNGVLYTKDGKTLVKCPSEKTGSFTIPSTVTKIARNAFLKCQKLNHITIPSSVTQIGNDAFSDCKNVTSITFNANIKTIPDYCFYNCASLDSITIPDGVTKICRNAFTKCTNLKSVSFSNELTSIQYEAFKKCESLASITIPKKVTEISSSTFEGCCNLKSVTLHNKVTTIASYAFLKCNNLVNIKNTENISYIGYSAFGDCKKLTKFSFGEDLHTISSYAFSNCTSLGNVFLPASVREIGNGAFCGAASSISVSSDNEFFSSEKGLLLNKSKSTLIQIPYGQKGNLTIPKTVTRVKDNAINSTLITTLTYPDNVKELTNRNIYNCPNLTTIHLPANLQKVYSRYYNPSHSECPKLSKILISKKNPNFSSYDGVLYNKNRTKLCFYPYGKRGTLKIPAECFKLTKQIRVNKLSSIKVAKGNEHYSSVNGALLNYSETKIVGFPCKQETYRISKEIQNIYYLTNNKAILSLNSVTCAKKNPYFYAKDGVVFEKNKKNNTLLFYPAHKKGDYTVPSSTTYIDDYAFEDSYYLTKLTITKNVKRYSSNRLSFFGCEALKEIKVDEGNLNSIRLRFSKDDNKKLTKITFPSNVMSIKITGLPKNVNIYGWDNTGAQTIAKKYNCNYIRRGTVPEKVSGMKMKKIVDKYELTWNRVQGVSGYQIYTKYETLAEISGSSKTSYKINNLYDIDASRIYVRPYQIQNGKKVYGKGNSLYIY